MSWTLTIPLADIAVSATPAVAETRFEHIFPVDGIATSTKTEAPALVRDGTFVILATVNGTTQATLRVDSGATDVVLPRTTFPLATPTGLGCALRSTAGLISPGLPQPCNL